MYFPALRQLVAIPSPQQVLLSVPLVLALRFVGLNVERQLILLRLTEFGATDGQVFLVLTHHGEEHGVTDRWRGAHLAFIEARVPPLRVTDLQHPIFRLGRVDGLEPLVTGVGVTADS